MPAPLVYGYVRVVTDDPLFVRSCREALAAWCAREGWHLGAVFTDIGSPLDVDNRIGFRGLLDAVILPRTTAVVMLDSGHLSSRIEVATELVRQLRRAGVAVRVRDGDLPPGAGSTERKAGYR
ncbi:hypothetical protein Acsp05_45490 [Actinokineospora sp. NBRC 105648]|nr:hypothetical protein Acsp05_45490 [Actinokineospora sp. NBRC 105648]